MFKGTKDAFGLGPGAEGQRNCMSEGSLSVENGHVFTNAAHTARWEAGIRIMFHTWVAEGSERLAHPLETHRKKQQSQGSDSERAGWGLLGAPCVSRSRAVVPHWGGFAF